MTTARNTVRLWLALGAGLLLGCTLNPDIPNARVICNVDNPHCPDGFVCEPIEMASVPIAVCCRMQGCTKKLAPADIDLVIRTAYPGGAPDAGPDAPAEDAPADGAAVDMTGGPTCGNGRLELNETCDPPSSCPTTCPKIACEVSELQGSAETCTARCVKVSSQTACVAGDQCCPAGCTVANDSDCACTCGNGKVETACGETCDPMSTCPTSCPAMGCMLRRLANPNSCQAQCVDDVMQTACVNADGCCPASCNAANDSDCKATCGNGVVESGESCDPITSCPTTCPPLGCTLRKLDGAASSCTARCVDNGMQTACASGDGCCPAGCTSANDNDCACTCGNGNVESACHETCDPLASCPTSCPPMGCTLRKLANPGTCQAQCVDNGTQTACVGGDGCCPPGCNATNDNDCKPACGNGVAESGETCDPPSSCPTSCPPLGCTKQKLTGATAQCTARCVDDGMQTVCASGDGCCPPGCTSANDNDCACTCGNNLVEAACQETCDPIGTCPTSCPPMACQKRRLVNGNTCQARCVDDTTIATCINNDGCCPAACNANTDNDCMPKCGNGAIENGETCDPPSSCPTTCPWNVCMKKKLGGSAALCTAACVDDGLQTVCAPGDGCCPPTCNATNDSDCTPKCGNGVVEAGETCDGNCPTTCPAVGCQKRKLQGTAGACNAACVNDTVIATCTNGDGCCASGCTSLSDNDCGCVCGNGVTEPACGEKCDGANCPTTCPPVGCQLRMLQGSGCTTECVDASKKTTCANDDMCCPTGMGTSCNANNDNNCSPVCGNAVLEAGETCDPVSACQTQFDTCIDNDDNVVKKQTGMVSNCTFVCATTPRACQASSDGHCPTGCTPCGDTCSGATQDIDCKLADGAACTSNNQCKVACTDGHCCGGTGTCPTCQACTGSNGTCVAITNAKDNVPANACAGVNSCDVNGNCRLDNGQSCGSDGTKCVSGFCADGVCCNVACGASCDTCSKSGSVGTCATAGLGTSPSPSCGTPYTCNGSSAGCPPAGCSSNSNCQSGYTCQTGSCQTCGMTGASCSHNNSACCSNVCFNFQCQ